MPVNRKQSVTRHVYGCRIASLLLLVMAKRLVHLGLVTEDAVHLRALAVGDDVQSPHQHCCRVPWKGRPCRQLSSASPRRAGSSTVLLHTVNLRNELTSGNDPVVCESLASGGFLATLHPENN